MDEKKPGSIVRSKPDGSFVLVHADGHEEPYRPPRTDTARIDAMTDADIARQIASDPEVAPEMTEDWFERANVVRHGKVIRRGKPGRPRLDAPKEQVTLRLDHDVLRRFRSTGPGWQSRINAALREHLERQG